MDHRKNQDNGGEENEYIHIIGRIKNINKDSINVYTINSKETFRCKCPYKCPFMVTDTISGICKRNSPESVDSIVKGKPTSTLIDTYTFIQYPYVKLSTDKDTIVACLYRALSGPRDRPILGVYQMYDKFVELATSDLDTFISELSMLWIKTKDESVFTSFYPCSTSDCIKVAEYWYTKRICRQLRY